MRARGWSKPGVVAVLAGVAAAGLWPAHLEAQAPCKRPCGPGEKPDGKGCCVAAGSREPPAPLAGESAPASCPAGMVGIPGGTYTLEERKDSATVGGFCLDTTEVTIDAYRSCVTAGACTAPDPYGNEPSFKAACNWQRPGAALHPVNCVSWIQATSFCGWASKRLPSEEEWEWAARGGDRATTYPWGNGAPSADKLNACGSKCATWVESRGGGEAKPLYQADDGWTTTAPVGSFPKGANRWGVQDLAGNVWEWTSSAWPAKKTDRVSRGGSWNVRLPSEVGAAVRGRGEQSFRDSEVGFRCARAR